MGKMKMMMKNKKEMPAFIERMLNDYLNLFVNTNTYEKFESEIYAVCTKIIRNKKLKGYEVIKKRLPADSKIMPGYIIKIEKKIC